MPESPTATAKQLKRECEAERYPKNDWLQNSSRPSLVCAFLINTKAYPHLLKFLSYRFHSGKQLLVSIITPAPDICTTKPVLTGSCFWGPVSQLYCAPKSAAISGQGWLEEAKPPGCPFSTAHPSLAAQKWCGDGKEVNLASYSKLSPAGATMGFSSVCDVACRHLGNQCGSGQTNRTIV